MVNLLLLLLLVVVVVVVVDERWGVVDRRWALERRFEGQRYSSRKVEVKASIMCHVTFAFCGEHTSLNRDSSCAFFVFFRHGNFGIAPFLLFVV